MSSVKPRPNAPRQNTSGDNPAQRAKMKKRAAVQRAFVTRSRVTLLYGLTGSLLSWLALPPVGWWPLAWVAPVPWLLLVRRELLPGRRPYAALWLSGFAFWMGALHWLRLPHPATSLGWLALSSYLAFYLPLFIALCRMAVHGLRMSIVIAAPVVWSGLELAQSHALTGINIATPGHSQYRWIELIQISDLCGGYGVSFVIMLVAACLARMLPLARTRRAFWPLVPAGATMAAVLAYGHFRTTGEHLRPGFKVALIQGSIDTEMKADPEQAQQVFKQYLLLTDRAVQENPGLDLVVWPETMFREPLRIYTPDMYPPAGEDWTKEELDVRAEELQMALSRMADRFKVPLLLGMDTVVFGPGNVHFYNSAVLVDADGKVRGRYDKMHPVMFGEYVPGATYLPWLYGLTPLDHGLDSGESPQALSVGGVRVAPNICFETLLPHCIRGQVATLSAAGNEPDVLVNLTNDGWFWGSSELDLHLMCGIFRAVECRKPLLIAANTGFSAVIDGDGRVLRQGPRRATDILVHDVQLDSRKSPYVRFGDWGAGLCLTFGAALAGVGLWRQRRRRIDAEGASGGPADLLPA
jgi:apolipoprotein N-acyltransferase